MTLRWRLVILHALIVAAVLAAFSVALVRGVRTNLGEQFDRQLALQVRAVASEIEFEGERWFIEPAAPLLDDYRAGSRRWFLVADTAGKVMVRSPVAETLALPFPDPGMRTLALAGEPYRELCMERAPDEPKAGMPARMRIACGACLAEVDAAVGSMVAQLWTIGPAVLLLSMLGGFWLVSRALRPIGAIARTAGQITAENLDHRIAVTGNDELARLSRTLNETFARLQEAFLREKRFTADASHELRTPLSVIAGNVELALNRPRTAEELRELLADIGASGERMRATVAGLLTLARADAGALQLLREPVALADLAEEVVQVHRPLAAVRQVTIACEVEGVTVDGDRERLRELLANLVTNAIRYNRRGGSVTVRVRRSGPHAVLEVEDTGIGIRAEDQARIFERFFRADPSRARDADGAETEGTGLGLAIARWIAAAHGGSIAVVSEVGRGSRFTVTLPAT